VKNILITGGGGYCGSLLTQNLLNKGHNVLIYDVFYFGKSHLPKFNKKLKIVEGDIRNEKLFSKVFTDNKIETVIHLACISNDASFELDESLSKTINFDCFENIVYLSKKNNVSHFIYASSSSVYGVSSQLNVTEDHELVPLTLYNRFKGDCEPILLSYANDNFAATIFRPATVCGYSPRMRFDLSVNILANQAINSKKITVFGGEQMRPNLHIKDYCEFVELLINFNKKKINKEIFNVGCQNLKIKDIAFIVKKIVDREFLSNVQIMYLPSNDNRSYHINSDKAKKILDYSPRLTVEDAVLELCNCFKKNMFVNSLDDKKYFNVKRLKELNAK
jgi:nucleoside-diphosphate-sugar epimerase